MQAYSPQEIEAQAQQYWQSKDAYRATEQPNKAKFYCLSMLPYPSGKLHMGHVRNYTIGDVLSRYHRMHGKNVLQPMGWDAFGLPAENAAMQNKVPPAQWTYDNIAYMKKQCQSLGFAFDWSRELATCKPDYYRWNQWLFLRMWEKGLVYKKKAWVNWDPIDQTVLANEQVIDGRGWRTGAAVEKREIPMYYMRITQYAEQLLADLDHLNGWPERVRVMQSNWLGKSEGVRFAFAHEIHDELGTLIQDGRLYVFTTRADTIMGVTFCAIAAEHPLATHAAKSNPQLAAFIEQCKRGSTMEADLATMEKKGMPTGLFVSHPLSQEKIPVWVGNYVLMAYGEGAVMGVPGHDERDFHFAKKYDLTIKQVIAPSRFAWGGGDIDVAPFTTDHWQAWYADYGICIHSGKYDGCDYPHAIDEIAADLKALGLGDKQVQWRLRDWGISRQRYWGTPIPIIYCESCGDVPVPDAELPVVLPENLIPDGTGNPLAKTPSFYQCSCPQCGKPAKRETDTMDTFVDSSWYFLRYCSPGATTMIDQRTQYWMSVDQYIGGIEHAILHLLYARFWTKVMRDLGLAQVDEPFTKLLTLGMVLNHIFFRKGTTGGINYFAPDEVELQQDENGRVTGAISRRDGQAVEYGGLGTMSKSKRNGVDPQEIIEKYGADTARAYSMFASPLEQTLEWSDAGVKGVFNFLRRLWDYGQKHKGQLTVTDLTGLTSGSAAGVLRREIQQILQQANHDYQRMQYNTVVAAGMKMLNALGDFKHNDSPADRAVIRESLSILLRVLAPVTPHITHVLWAELSFAEQYGDLLDAPWPQVDETALAQDTVELVLQINGKLRGHFQVPAGYSSEQIETMARNNEIVLKHASHTAIKKVIVVPGRLVNVVV